MITIDFPPPTKGKANWDGTNARGWIQLKGVRVETRDASVWQVPAFVVKGVPRNQQAQYYPTIEMPNDPNVLTDFIVSIVKEANFSHVDRIQLMDQIHALR